MWGYKENIAPSIKVGYVFRTMLTTNILIRPIMYHSIFSWVFFINYGGTNFFNSEIKETFGRKG